MCGFAGYLTTQPNTAEGHIAALTRMTDPITHRGPDDSGAWADPAAGIALGFRRLSIIDLSALGHQPMRSYSARYTVVFNGEIYNHAALRETLERQGARFRGRSDTEVMLAAFEAWGVTDSITRFDGMFAIAVWDAEARCLHLVRDRFGKKPLYVYATPGYITFGSELKALAAGPSFDKTLDYAAITAYLRYLYIPSPRTIYRAVTKLPPGHILTIRDPKAALPEPSAYWSLPEVASRGKAASFTGTDAEGIAAGEREIARAVRARMIADVPIGAFLSGGIDSSLVVAMMQEASATPVRTFCIAFAENAFNEAHHAAAVARHLGTDHTEIRMTADDALALIPEMPNWFDEPMADPSQLPTYLVSRAARQEVTVALTGDGGDELFAGYNRYAFGRRLIGGAMSIGSIGRRMAARGVDIAEAVGAQPMLRAFAGASAEVGGQHGHHKAAVKLRAALRQHTAATMYRSLLSVGMQEPMRFVRMGWDIPSAIEPTFDTPVPRTILEKMMLADQLEYLPDDLLAKVDRTSMAVSLEVRAPLLDHHVAELSWRLPMRFKLRGGTSKWLLRQLLYARIPRSVVDRPKMGFSVPVEDWLRGPLRRWAEDLIESLASDSSGLIEAQQVRSLWKDFSLRSPNSNTTALWALLNLQAWRSRWG